MKSDVTPLKWDNETLYLLDQRILPHQEEWVTVTNVEECFHAIRDMVVRGAPLIGFTAIWGVVLYLKNNSNASLDSYIERLNYLRTARPTAVNLEFEIDKAIIRGSEFHKMNGNWNGFYDEMVQFAKDQMTKLLEDNLAMAKTALDELNGRLEDRPWNVMTICNTGALACGPMGTALGVIEYLGENKKIEKVWVSETRPYMQGIRLTAYELVKLGLPHDIVVEGASNYLMGRNMVDAIFTGADRIASNGDSANKIGTGTLSIIAKYFNVPFYVVAPTSSFDLNINSGDEIDIELRDPNEILSVQGIRIAPNESTAFNPSFDVALAENITGIICEKGLISPVTKENLLRVVNQ
jgi:methylthioribose-1-phosphate isomerase